MIWVWRFRLKKSGWLRRWWLRDARCAVASGLAALVLGVGWGRVEGSEGIWNVGIFLLLWNIPRVPDGSGDGFGRVPEELRAFERFWWWCHLTARGLHELILPDKSMLSPNTRMSQGMVDTFFPSRRLWCLSGSKALGRLSFGQVPGGPPSRVNSGRFLFLGGVHLFQSKVSGRGWECFCEIQWNLERFWPWFW